MKKIIGLVPVLIIIVGGIAGYFLIINNRNLDTKDNSNDDTVENEENINQGEDNPVVETVDNKQIRVSDGTHEIIFELNDTGAAMGLYDQLPITVQIDSYGLNEKIFYPARDLDIYSAILANAGDKGVLAYYQPWGDIVMFYDSFEAADGLYELGRAIIGEDYIENLTGEVTVEKASE